MHKRVIVVLGVISLLGPKISLAEEVAASATAQAQPKELGAHWEFAGWYGGGAFPALAIDPKRRGRVYVGSDVAGLYRSDDYGNTWQHASRGLGSVHIAVIATAPSDTRVVYAGTKGGLYVSRDGGDSWEAADRLNNSISFERPTSARSISVSRANAEQVCVGAYTGTVACSPDAGRTWHLLGETGKPFGEKTPITALALSADENRLWASSKQGLARFDFAAKRWTTFRDGPKPVTDIVLAGDNPEYLLAAGQEAVWISEDGGENWWATAKVPKGKSERLAVRFNENEFWIGVVWNEGWQGGIVASDDRGITWSSLYGHMVPDPVDDPTRLWQPPGGRTLWMQFAPSQPSLMLRTDWWGIYRSEDGGVTWVEKVHGAPNSVGSDIFITRKGRIFVATMDNGLLATDDGGVTYHPLFPNKGYSDSINGHVWRVLTLDPDGKNVVATSSPWGQRLNQVIVSADGGVNFDIVREGLPKARPSHNTMWGEGYLRALAKDPNNPKILYLGIDGDDGGGIFVSDDAGRHWNRLPHQPSALRVYNGLAEDPTESDRILWGACGTGGGVYLSRNRGQTWEHVLQEMQWVFDLAIAKDGTMYAAGDQSGPTLYVSRDQGTHWKKLYHFPGKGALDALAIDPYHPKRMAVSTVYWSMTTGGKIFLSEDAGESWIDITDDLPEGQGAAAMAFSPDGYLYMSPYAGSVHRRRL